MSDDRVHLGAYYVLAGSKTKLILTMWEYGEPVPDKNLTFTLDQLKAVHELMGQAIEHFKENEDGDPTD